MNALKKVIQNHLKKKLLEEMLIFKHQLQKIVKHQFQKIVKLQFQKIVKLQFQKIVNQQLKKIVKNQLKIIVKNQLKKISQEVTEIPAENTQSAGDNSKPEDMKKMMMIMTQIYRNYLLLYLVYYYFKFLNFLSWNKN